MEIVQKILSLFFINSFIGWLIEVFYVSFDNKKLCNRGFLIGPVCPIYGISSVVITLLLERFQKDYVFVFFASLIICTILEYLTSFIMGKYCAPLVCGTNSSNCRSSRRINYIIRKGCFMRMFFGCII